MLAVTHDQGEAFALADRVVVMRDGRIAQSGTPLDVWQRPASEFVARFLGFDNIADGEVSGGTAVTEWGKVPVPDGTSEGVVRLMVRPGGVRLGPPEGALRCEVVARTFRGGHVGVLLRPERGPALDAECGLRDAPEVGAVVGATFVPQDVVVLTPP